MKQGVINKYMKIKKFRIKNYKSIVDSGDCYADDKLTIFAGKNESGKTSILEALEDFNYGKKIDDKAKSLKYDETLPEITVTFEISVEELKEYFEYFKIEKEFIESKDIEITKNILINIL